MYLHELGEEEASFTKEEMQAGKHQDYELKLCDQFLSQPPTSVPAATPVSVTPTATRSTTSVTNGPSTLSSTAGDAAILNGKHSTATR